MLVGVSAFAADSARQTLNFNREWKFKLGDEKGAEAPAFEDAQWSAVGLPHSFSTPYFLADKFYTGYGWYRKHFDVPAAWKNKRVSIEFEAAFQDAEVFVNGKAVGRHEGGYTGFSLDITDAVKAGDNVVAVRLNNLWRGDLAPRAGEHVFSGGIYRDVYLVVTDPLHVAWYGTFVTTPEVSKESATVNIKTEVKNDTAQSKKATVLTRVVDAAGKEAAKVKSDLTIAAGE
ncbi:TPA: beta-galactosidase, partial [Candidatus Sumerlaeota bacterium]|nr:beta-galactosidase [Candidatus Sumerlaeota bacterium]